MRAALKILILKTGTGGNMIKSSLKHFSGCPKAGNKAITTRSNGIDTCMLREVFFPNMVSKNEIFFG